MNSFFDKVKHLADEHDEKVDQALEKVGDVIDERTGGKYTEHIEKGVAAAQEYTGKNDTQP
ncbi:antitoxin [Dactylosporangium sp. NPDC051485]|uniref:antitoxin n=1 Tax=Dactylosporangium sp. NPDC051485 TaxID=3154846 RepID=UPI00342D3461